MEYIAPDKSYPMWAQVVEFVSEQFEIKSYGFTITHEKLKELMGIMPAQTISESKKEQLDYLAGMKKARDTLLEDYNLCLFPVIGEGYQLLCPDDQVRKGADYYLQKSQRALSRTMNTLANVDAEMLSLENRNLQLLKMSRVAFIKSAFRKRRIPLQPALKKQIE